MTGTYSHVVSGNHCAGDQTCDCQPVRHQAGPIRPNQKTGNHAQKKCNPAGELHTVVSAPLLCCRRKIVVGFLVSGTHNLLQFIIKNIVHCVLHYHWAPHPAPIFLTLKKHRKEVISPHSLVDGPCCGFLVDLSGIEPASADYEPAALTD